MKKSFFTLLLLTVFQLSFSQTVLDYKVKNASNEKERTVLLDLFRARLLKEYQQEFIFTVNHFKLSKEYAWLMTDVKRKDGKQIKLKYESDDCCHAEALFKKTGNKWTIADSGVFSSDVWWSNIHDKFRDLPFVIFPSN